MHTCQNGWSVKSNPELRVCDREYGCTDLECCTYGSCPVPVHFTKHNQIENLIPGFWERIQGNGWNANIYLDENIGTDEDIIGICFKN